MAKKLPKALDGAAAALRDLDALMAASGCYSPGALCHNDLVASNIMRTDAGRVVFVDFEYAGRGCPAFDIAKLAARLSSQEDENFRTTRGHIP